MRLKRTPGKRDLLAVQSADVHRVTKAKVHRAGRCAGRSSAFRRWVGLPKPACESDFNPLPIVTERILEAAGVAAAPVVQAAERERLRQRRVELLEYLRTRTTGKEVM